MGKNRSNVPKYIISISIASALMLYCFRQLDWADFISGLKACDWGYVALSMLIGLLAFYFRALRWRELILPIDPSTSRLTVFNAINISYLVNMLLPRVGEFVRCGVVTAHSKSDPESPPGENRKLASYDKVLGTAVVGRSSDVIMLFLLLVGFLVFTWHRFGEFFAEKIFGQASEKLSSGNVLTLAAFASLACVLVWIPFRFRSRWKVFEKASDFFKGVWHGVGSCLRMKRAWAFLTLTILIWVCYWMMSLTILKAVQGISLGDLSPELASAVTGLASLGATDALFLMLAGSLSSIVPVPGGFGAFHYIVALAISTVYGTPFQFGMLFATLSHESQAVVQLLAGSLSSLVEAVRKKSSSQENSKRVI